ncbi:MAG TPA: MBL fold metallo-hydrolase [Thermoplasmata archaeon]|nr:MBL fold metallo-hydrolase [Thermoplasmata archaeon]
MLGGDGAFPSPGGACSGYLVEHDGFHLLIDPGYATFPALVQRLGAEQVDAVLVSHGHPDHCSDLNPLLRARTVRSRTHVAPLPVYALPDALGPVLGLDRVGMLDGSIVRHEIAPGGRLTIGPIHVATASLPHFLPNVGVRLTAGGRSLAYTGDSGPSPNLLPLAEGVDLFLAEATYVADEADESQAASLSSALQRGEAARRAGVRRLLLTHIFPGTDRDDLEHAARQEYSGVVATATPGMVVDLAPKTEGHEPF